MNETLTIKVEPARLEVRSGGDEGGPTTITGYAAVFDRYSRNLGGFVEVVRRSAFDQTLAAGHDLIAQVDHQGMPIGRRSAGNLQVTIDDVGLRYEIEVRTSHGRAAAETIGAGLIIGSSFAFATRADDWGYTEQGYPLRELREVELFELGPVANPAYRDTEGLVALRAAMHSLSEQRGLPLAEVEAAAQKNELRSLLEGDGEERAVTPGAPTSPLVSYRRRLRVLELTDPSRPS